MAGTLNVYGEDGDPTPTYQFIRNRAKALYIIQGNHDLPPSNIKDLTEMKNNDGTYCYLPDGKPVNTLVGKIGGVHGIISDHKHPYKKSEQQYIRLLHKVLQNRLDILVTHDTPSFYYEKHTECIGKKQLYEAVRNYKPKIYIYGHCHHPFFYKNKVNIHFFNVDARVLIIDLE